jgi:hypothetical protein
LIALLLLIAAAGAFALAFVRSPYRTGVGVDRPQPAPFSHDHHVRGLGIDCRYCHQTVEDQAFAGMPATSTCMNCHWQIWPEAPVLEAVRASWRENAPLHWRRVHDLPDFVYFNHAIHVRKGIGCSTCHGQVDAMPMMHKTQALFMQWCLECHRAPEKFIRPRSEIFNMDWQPATLTAEQRAQLAEEYGLRKKGTTDCSTCHR